MGMYGYSQIKKTVIHRSAVYADDSGKPALGSGVDLGGEVGDIWRYCLVQVKFGDTLGASSRSADITPLFGDSVVGVYLSGEKKTITEDKRLVVEVDACRDFYVLIDNLGTQTVIDETIGTGDDVTTIFNHTCTKHPVKKSTVTVHYTIGSTNYTATDDGNGNISGTSCTGTINYETGAVSLTFSIAPDNGTDITIDYMGISEVSVYLTPFNE